MDSILNYIGGKSLSAKKIVQLMPEHFCYVETNAGGLWVFFAKPKTHVEIVNDINSNLINFWRVVQRQPNEFIERSKYEMYSRELYYEYCSDFDSGKYYRLPELERAFRFFCMIKEAFGSKWKAGWGYGKSRNQADAFFNEFKIIDQIAERLKHCQIDNKDCRKVIEDYDGEETLFFCDPPYIKSDNDAQYFKSTDQKKNLSFTLHDHQELYYALTKIKGKFILTIDDAPFIRERYCVGDQGENGFWWQENIIHYSSAAGPDRRHATELIITNYDMFKVAEQNKLKSEKKVEKVNPNNKSIFDFD